MHLTKSVLVGLLTTAVPWAKLVLHLDFESYPAGFEIVGDVPFEVGPRLPENPHFAKDFPEHLRLHRH